MLSTNTDLDNYPLVNSIVPYVICTTSILSDYTFDTSKVRIFSGFSILYAMLSNLKFLRGKFSVRLFSYIHYLIKIYSSYLQLQKLSKNELLSDIF